MEKKKFNSCVLAILKTLSYGGTFKYPLSFYQILNNLISKNYFSAKKVKKELKKLTEAGVIKNIGGKYILSDIEPHDVDKRKKFTGEIIERNEFVFKALEKIPWVKMIAVTGSAANYNVEERADVDLFFVTEKNRLWISRGLVFIILKVLNKLPTDQKKREICPNIFIDERNLSWAKKKRNLYVAQNIISMQPIINRDEIYLKFMYANRWVLKYYSNLKINFPNNPSGAKKKNGAVMNLLEFLVRKIQIFHMKKKITTEIANDKLIHFNKNDSSKKILRSYKKIFKNIAR